EPSRPVSAQPRQDLARGAAAGEDGAVHRAVVDRRGLASGPVDAADGAAQHVAERGPSPRAEVARVAATRPGLLGPGPLDDAVGVAGAPAEQLGEPAQDDRAALGLGALVEPPRLAREHEG